MMYDTLKLVLTNEFDPSINFLDDIPSSIDIYSQGIEYGTPVVRGRVKNLKVCIKASKITIEGSFHVFCKGNNLDAMSFKEFTKASNSLEAMLGWPLEHALVRRLDFSGNLLLKHEVEAYFCYFSEKSRFKKMVLDNGIILHSEEKQLIFYDKLNAMKKKREAIPDYFKNKHVMRFELRYTKKLGKAFNKAKISLATLKDPSFFVQLCHTWRDEFKSIVMQMKSPTDIAPTGSKTKLIEQLALKQINDIGRDAFLREVTSWQETGQITKKEAYEIRKFVREKGSESYPLAENELIRELNQKIKVAGRYEV